MPVSILVFRSSFRADDCSLMTAIEVFPGKGALNGFTGSPSVRVWGGGSAGWIPCFGSPDAISTLTDCEADSVAGAFDKISSKYSAYTQPLPWMSPSTSTLYHKPSFSIILTLWPFGTILRMTPDGPGFFLRLTLAEALASHCSELFPATVQHMRMPTARTSMDFLGPISLIFI